jgi:small subunit ribosomal protein S17e
MCPSYAFLSSALTINAISAQSISRSLTARNVSRTFDRIQISKVYVGCDLLMSSPVSKLFKLGKVRTDTVKRISRELLRRFPDRFTGDFESDKQSVNDLVTTPSKRLRNRIAGYITRLKMVEAERAAATEAAVEAPEAPLSDIGTE